MDIGNGHVVIVNGVKFVVSMSTDIDLREIEKGVVGFNGQVFYVFPQTTTNAQPTISVKEWRIHSRTSDTVYSVTFDGKDWTCECPHFVAHKENPESRENCWHIKSCKEKI